MFQLYAINGTEKMMFIPFQGNLNWFHRFKKWMVYLFQPIILLINLIQFPKLQKVRMKKFRIAKIIEHPVKNF